MSDKQQAEWVAAATKEVIAYLASATADNKMRQIRDLKKHEVEAMAHAVIFGYVTTRKKQADEEELMRMTGEFDDDISDLFV